MGSASKVLPGMAGLSMRQQPRLVHYGPQVGLSTLFRPLLKSAGPRPSLDVTYCPEGGRVSLQFSAKAALGIPEQTLLLVLLELAKEQYAAFADAMVLDANPTNPVSAELWSRLNKGFLAAPERALRLETTWYELNRRYGEQVGGSAIATRRKQLKRLCEVVVWEVSHDQKGSERQSYLVVWLTSDDKRLHLALNAKLAAALLGSPYAQVSLSERAALEKDVAKAVHAFLSTALAPGNSLRIGVDTLVERFWPGSGGSGKAPDKTHRSRRRYIREALKSIGRLAMWSVENERAELVRVRRASQKHKDGDGEMTSHIANKTTSYRHPVLAKCPSNIKDLATLDASGLFFNKKGSA